MKIHSKIAVFGGGCFWCTEAIFNHLKGVLSVVPGYAGGTTKNPTYERVASGTTGHAEVTKIEYNPEQISYEDLLTVFFATHDPTSLNRQGADVGTQYRSIILYTDEMQKNAAEKFIKELNESGLNAKGVGRPSPTADGLGTGPWPVLGPKVVTEVKPLEKFHEAEDEHRKYYEKNASGPYCQIVINPKLQQLEERFNKLLK